MSTAPTFLINGRFLTRRLSGVDRVAFELLRALSALRTEGAFDAAFELAVPADCTPHQIARLSGIEIAQLHRGRRSGQIWEQTELHSLRPEAVLLSLCNTGPLLRAQQAIFIHDAQVFLEPSSYSPAFRLWYRIAQPLLARRSQTVLTNSHYSLRNLERYGVVPSGGAAVVPLGCDHLAEILPDLSTLETFGLTPDSYVLALGNLAPHKNLIMLMRAAAARGPDAPPLVIAGGGNPRVFQDAGLALPDGVRLLGRVSDPQLRMLYKSARMFVFPSLTEGFGLPPLEAMTLECPVIATSAAAVPEICGDAALLVDPRDEAGWTQAMVALAGDAVRRSDLVARGRVRAARFTWRRSALELLAASGVGCEAAGEPDHQSTSQSGSLACRS